ncbi:hypothetical protein M0R04_13800 [Candidatus Dojkabacteria bacterium]|jgi:hypothetical protein|nr:hypothetical protein [Candidatus Dojkabacteria bacterium]
MEENYNNLISKLKELKDKKADPVEVVAKNLNEKVDKLETKIDTKFDTLSEELKKKLEEELVYDVDEEKIAQNVLDRIAVPEDGQDYVLTEKDKKEIASSIKVPIVEKVVEHTETIVEKPIVTNEIKEVAKYEDREQIVEKINTGKKDDLKIKLKQIEDSDKLSTQESVDRALSILDQRTKFLINKQGGSGGGTFATITGDPYDNTNLTTALDAKLNINQTTPQTTVGTFTFPDLVVTSRIKFNNTDSNTQLGYLAGNSLVSGARFNTLVGESAGYFLNNTSADYNTALGYGTLTFVTSGTRNTAVGGNAGQLISNGDDNTLVGYSAGSGSLGSPMSRSTIIGSGISGLHGDEVIKIGYRAGKYDTASSSFYIDSIDRVNTAGGKAGALLYGTFNATPASQTLVINAGVTISTLTSNGFVKTSGGTGALSIDTTAYLDTTTASDTYVPYSNQVYDINLSTTLKFVGSGGNTSNIYGDSTQDLHVEAEGTLYLDSNVSSAYKLNIGSDATFRGTFDFKETTTIDNVNGANIVITQVGIGTTNIPYASSDYFAVQIWAYFLDGSTKVFSGTSGDGDYFYPDSTPDPYHINVTWDAVTGAVGYLVYFFTTPNIAGATGSAVYTLTNSVNWGDGTEATAFNFTATFPTTVPLPNSPYGVDLYPNAQGDLITPQGFFGKFVDVTNAYLDNTLYLRDVLGSAGVGNLSYFRQDATWDVFNFSAAQDPIFRMGGTTGNGFSFEFTGGSSRLLLVGASTGSIFSLEDNTGVPAGKPISFRTGATSNWTAMNDVLTILGNGSGVDFYGTLTGTNIITDGDTYWTGDGSGLPYGEMYASNVTQTVTVSATDTYYEIDGNLTGGELNLCTFPDDHYVLVQKAGRYLINWSLSVYCANANQEVEGAVMKGGTAQTKGTAHANMITANTPVTLGGTLILDLAVNDQISLSVSNHTATNNVIMQHANLTLSMVGGT